MKRKKLKVFFFINGKEIATHRITVRRISDRVIKKTFAIKIWRKEPTSPVPKGKKSKLSL